MKTLKTVLFVFAIVATAAQVAIVASAAETTEVEKSELSLSDGSTTLLRLVGFFATLPMVFGGIMCLGYGDPLLLLVDVVLDGVVFKAKPWAVALQTLVITLLWFAADVF